MIVNYAATEDTWIWRCGADDGRCPGAFQVGCDNVYTTTTTDPDAPWVQLGCGTAQQQYLFSDEKHTWDEARSECESYGGWLVAVETQAEYNCLLRYGNSQGYNSWFWTDGMFQQAPAGHDSSTPTVCSEALNSLINCFCLAHTDEHEIWVHASNNADVTWFSPKWTCHADANFHAGGGDAFIIHMGERRLSGSYCDTDKTTRRNYICEKH